MVAKEQCRVLTLVCDLGGGWAWSMGQCTLQDHKQEVYVSPVRGRLLRGMSLIKHHGSPNVPRALTDDLPAWLP